MNAIIIEDEKLSAEHLITLLNKIDESIQVVAIFESVKKSIEAFKNGINCDLIFVDIHLADGLSFEIFKEVNTDIPVIFTTAFDEYAIKAFTLNSIDYLLKPIGIIDLKRALDKFNKQKNYNPAILEILATAYNTLNKQYKTRFMVKMGDSIKTVKTEEISHFIFEDSIVLLTTDRGKRYALDFTLAALEELLDPAIFFRINRKVIVNISVIQKVSSYFNSRLKLNLLTLQDDDCIVSRERVGDFKKWLDK